MESNNTVESWHSISSSLLFQVKERQPEAWARLSHLLGPLIYGWVRRSGLQPNDSEDITQQVLQAIYQNVERFRREKKGDSFTGWTWTITRNKIRDYFRTMPERPMVEGGTEAQARFQQLPETPPTEEKPGQPSVSAQLTHRALELVKSEFGTKVWDAFWRTTVERERPATVAEELQMTVHAVYKAKSRVLRRVRQELEGIVEEATI